MITRHRFSLFIFAFSLVLCPLSGRAATLLADYALAGTESAGVVWENLGSSNSALAPASGSGMFSVASPGFVATAGIYSYMGNYSVTTSKVDFAFDVQTVVFQLQWAPNPEVAAPFGDGALLSFNGGSQSLVADYAGQTTATTSVYVPAIGQTVEYSVYTWQWDLSAIGDTDISSVSIVTQLAVHSSVVASSLEASDAANSQVFTAVPEPSVVGLLGIAIVAAAAWGFRRRARAIHR